MTEKDLFKKKKEKKKVKESKHTVIIWGTEKMLKLT